MCVEIQRRDKNTIVLLRQVDVYGTQTSREKKRTTTRRHFRNIPERVVSGRTTTVARIDYNLLRIIPLLLIRRRNNRTDDIIGTSKHCRYNILLVRQLNVFPSYARRVVMAQWRTTDPNFEGGAG